MSISPLVTNNFLDSCAFDPKYEPEHTAARKIYQLWESGVLLIQIAHSTLKETEHPSTPSWVKDAAGSLLFTEEVNLADEEKSMLARIERVLAGKGKVENIKQDARHVFEAQKYGSYFITADTRILKRATELREISGGIHVVTPSEFLALVLDQMEGDT